MSSHHIWDRSSAIETRLYSDWNQQRHCTNTRQYIMLPSIPSSVSYIIHTSTTWYLPFYSIFLFPIHPPSLLLLFPLSVVLLPYPFFITSYLLNVSLVLLDILSKHVWMRHTRKNMQKGPNGFILCTTLEEKPLLTLMRWFPSLTSSSHNNLLVYW